CMQSVEYPYTF
nr:immunoglobulin light chain junction region [Macaca mulatta]MOW34143.1 immunoglobulin light chain junction region [Macaca mulatta]MOW34223.1 immunoglobulin light chain junction region [Macaca mulatta]MOW34237.1 immunoglobulin light chain junction region [Macaca mulatta]MOW34489.1 immunoglobulin light chain junction region [Macaca mulatta]